MSDWPCTYYEDIPYFHVGTRLGQTVELCYQPRIAGYVVGYNHKVDSWLVQLTMPYGENSSVFAVFTEAALHAIEAKRAAVDQTLRAKRKGGES